MVISRTPAVIRSALIGSGSINTLTTGLVVLVIGAVSSTAQAAASPVSIAHEWHPGLLAFAVPFFFFGATAYAFWRKFARSVAVATAVGVLATFLVEFLMTGATSSARQAIVAYTMLSALFSGLGAACATLLARERERIGAKKTAIAVIAGLILGLGVVAAFAAFSALVSPTRGQFAAVFFCSFLVVVGGGAFTIAMTTGSIGGTAGAITLAIAASIMFLDDTGYILAVCLMTYLPITIVAAWLGALTGRRQREHVV